MASSDEINDAIDRGLEFVRSMRSNDGLWRDFKTFSGASLDLVSGFIAYAISNTGEADEITLPVVKYLAERQRSNGGWPYNSSFPTDCNSTAWVLMSLSTGFSWRPSLIERGIHYIVMHQDTESGGFATYVLQDERKKFVQVQQKDEVSAWYDVHISVTSVATQCLLLHGFSVENEIVQKAIKYLLRQRNKAGLWNSYWWKGYGYSTYLALKVLSMCKSLPEYLIQKSIQFFLSDQTEIGGWNDSFGTKCEVFATSFILLSLLLYPNGETMSASKRGVNWLVKQQNSDGSWPTAPILRLPPPIITNPVSVTEWPYNKLDTGVFIEDTGRAFTTSAALWVLMLFRSIT